MNMINLSIAYKIKRRRKELGITGVRMANLLEISQQHYSRIENGHVKITAEHLFSIAFILKVKPQDLLPTYIFRNEKDIIIAKQTLLAETTIPIKGNNTPLT